MRRRWIIGLVALIAVAALLSQHQKASVAPLPEFRPFITDRAFYDAAFAANASIFVQPGIQGILVSHHLLAASLIAHPFAIAGSDRPLTVVIISPDHFYRGAAPMTTVAARWSTPYGVLQPDSTVVAALASSAYINEDAGPFTLEHGIYTITPFIAHAFPGARVVPLIVKDTASQSAIDDAARIIARLAGDIFIVGSFDFTHDSTMAQAEINDRRSVPIVSALDISRIGQVAVDSHAGLATFLAALKARGASQFALLHSTNSARLTGRLTQTDVTSYIVGIFTR